MVDDKPIKSSLRITDVNSAEFFYLFGEDSDAPKRLPENLKDSALEMLLEDPVYIILFCVKLGLESQSLFLR